MEMRLQSSAQQRNIMDKTGIKSVEDLMYADLRRVGWDKADAFYAAYHDIYSDLPKLKQTRLMKSIEADPAIHARMTQTIEGEEILSHNELAKETSKEKIISDLILARKNTKMGSKDWADYTKMIADYTKIKQDDIRADEQPIRYYLPVRYPRTCKDCLIYQNGKQIKD